MKQTEEVEYAAVTPAYFNASRLQIILVLLLTDLAAILLSFWLSFEARRLLPFFPPLGHGIGIYLEAWPILIVWPIIFWREGLYPGLWVIGSEQLRLVAGGTTLAGLIVMGATFVTKTGESYSRPIIVGTWLASLVLLPLARMVVRRLLSGLGLSGPRCVVLGAGVTGSSVVRQLSKQHPPALTAKAFFDDDPTKHGRKLAGVPIVGPISEAPSWALGHRIHVLIVAMPGVSRDRLVPIIERDSRVFRRVIVIPDLFGLSSVDTDTRDVGGILAVEIRKNLLGRSSRVVKRLLDIVFASLLGAVAVPLSCLISLAILLESGLPVTFGHQRVGFEGKPFVAWKFRTMVRDADAVLARHLEKDPGLRSEWEKTQKLRDDPRFTHVGRLLRRLSLDELPQLWNVLKGEMSLVGPRPIIESEMPRYGDQIHMYMQVRPGLTGLWQVSGRSSLDYGQRVEMDVYYIRNWSIWLDLVILGRTAWVVLAGIGAY